MKFQSSMFYHIRLTINRILLIQQILEIPNVFCRVSNITLINRLSESPSTSKNVNQSTLSSPSFQAVAGDTSQPRRLLEMQHVRRKLHGNFAKWKPRIGPIVANERLPTRMGI